jgi:hypothetical protein
MKFVNSTLDIILHWLKHLKRPGDKDFEFVNYKHELYALPSYASIADPTVVMYNIYCPEWSRTTPINEICDMGLFVPAKKIVTNGLKKHFADQLSELNEHNKLLVYPPKPQEKATFPLSLYLRDQNGKYFISNEIPLPTDCEVEGIVIKDRIFLRKPIIPGEIDKENPTIADLCALATAIHPEAKPLFFCGYAEHELTMSLFLFGKKYRQTAELLKQNYGVEMPSFENNIAYIAGGDGYLKSSEEAEKISLFCYKDEVIGSSFVNIKQIKQMFAVIQWK